MSKASDKQIIFSLVGVGRIHLPKRQVLKDIYLSFFYGAKIGVLGLNGSRKSTLLRIIAGVDTDYTGEVRFSKGYSVGYLEQEPHLTAGKTVKDVVQEGRQEVIDLLEAYEKVNERFTEELSAEELASLLARQGELQEKIEAANGWEVETELEIAMDALRCPPPDTPVDVLSGGERRRVVLCRLLIQEPDILLLDEPTNHLDAETVQWLEQHLTRYEGTVIAVTHDRYFLDNVAGWILELDRGHGIPFEGNYSSWLEQKQARLAQEEKHESKRRKSLENELKWVRMAPRARHAKSKARIARYEELLSREHEKVAEDLEIYIPSGPRLGDVVLESDQLQKGYDDRVLIEDLSFQLPPGGIVGVIGANGAGKTTLLRMIVGKEKPDGGALRLGETVKLGYVDQDRELDGDKNVWEVVSGETRHRDSWRARSSISRLRRPFQLQRLGSAEACRRSFGRRTQPRASCLDAQGRCELPAPRRAHERSRRQHPSGPRRGAPRVRRHCPRREPRSMVSRSYRDTHPGLRGRQQRRLVRWELHGLRGLTAGGAWENKQNAPTRSSTRSCLGADPSEPRVRKSRPGEIFDCTCLTC